MIADPQQAAEVSSQSAINQSALDHWSEASMSTVTVRAEWVRDQVFLLRDRHDFPIVMTQPQGVTGADLLPLSLIGCAAWDIVAILQKQRQQLTGLHVTAESEQDPEPPWRFRRIHIVYRLTGHDLNAAQVRRAIELSETRYCSIYATLRAVVEITSDFEIVAG
jgi:putative redox protein